ncbi:hypothetical protein IL306_004158 [Fusarium sp. DS 682]|nr:hypothetical protein IL306_004158 [Fusarium sp. DS 682]
MTLTNNSTSQGQEDITVLIVGGGFSGIAALHRCRKLGLNAKILEKGDSFGGVWHWNRYPGARVDSEWPLYQLNIPEVYEGWTFKERFPDHHELREYIAHLDKSLDLKKYTIFRAEVVDASFDITAHRWSVLTASGLRLSAKYLILATGLLHKPYIPEFQGIENYRGRVIHSSSWPEDLGCEGKKVGIIGSGATAVQIVQELAKTTAASGSLTVMMRRPSTCIPLQQQRLSIEEQEKWKSWFGSLFAAGRQSFTGFPLSNTGKCVPEVTKEEHDSRLETLWQRGAFNFLLCGYLDTVSNLDSNRAMYDFWARKIRERMSNPVKRDIMAPLEPLYPIGTKRPPLENDYYECLDMEHVEIVSLFQNPIAKFVEDGVILEDGSHRQLDIVALATGFDSYTGSYALSFPERPDFGVG